LKVCVVAESLPPQVCEVGDLTGALIDASHNRGIEVAAKLDPNEVSDTVRHAHAAYLAPIGGLHLQFIEYQRIIAPGIVGVVLQAGAGAAQPSLLRTA
jgi:hypothetical protein